MRAMASDASCDASRIRRLIRVIHHQPRHGDGQRRLVPGGGCTTAAIHRSGRPATFSWTRQAIPHNMVRGAMRIAARSGSSAGNASAILRARSQLSRAAAMSRLVAHVAARMCQPYAACSSPAASRCSAISAAFSSSRRRAHVLGSRRPGAGATGRDRISAVIRRPPRGSAGGGRRTRRCGVNRT